MAFTNFVTAVAPVKVTEFKSLVIAQASENDIVLMDKVASGNGQVWMLSSTGKPRITVLAYENGQIIWQNVNPKRIGIECRFIKKWANQTK